VARQLSRESDERASAIEEEYRERADELCKRCMAAAQRKRQAIVDKACRSAQMEAREISEDIDEKIATLEKKADQNRQGAIQLVKQRVWGTGGGTGLESD